MPASREWSALSHMPSPLPRRNWMVAWSFRSCFARSPASRPFQLRPSPSLRWDGFRKLPVSGPARRSLILRPAPSSGRLLRPSPPECFNHFVTSMAAPITSGWNRQVAGRGSHPLNTSAFPRRTQRLKRSPRQAETVVVVRVGGTGDAAVGTAQIDIIVDPAPAAQNAGPP